MPGYQVRLAPLLPRGDILTLTQQCEAHHPGDGDRAEASVGVILAQIIFTGDVTLESLQLLVILISF